MVSTINPSLDPNGVFALVTPIARNVIKESFELTCDVSRLSAHFDRLGWKRAMMSDVARFGAGVEIGFIREETTRTPEGPVTTALPVLGYVTDFVRFTALPYDNYRVAVDGGETGRYGPDYHVWMKM